jgi:hypothetical protein
MVIIMAKLTSAAGLSGTLDDQAQDVSNISAAAQPGNYKRLIAISMSYPADIHSTSEEI